MTPLPIGRGARLLLLGLALAAARAAGAYDTHQLLQSRLDPKLKLQTIETDHFRIHFDPTLKESADELARLAEPVEAAVSSKLRWHVRGKTDVVLVSTNDRTDVYTITYPTTQIFINVAPPYMAQAIFHYGRWLRWLLVHEYTHVVHQDRVAGLSKLLRPALGTFARPNMLHPPWLREGLAVVTETELEPSGRADSTTYRMMLRSAERAGLLGDSAFGSPESASVMLGEKWPWVLRSYLWGSVLAQTIAAEKPDAMAALMESGARGIPGLLGSALGRAGLPPVGTLQEKAVAWTRARAQSELVILQRRPETPVVALTSDGYDKFGPAIAPDASEIAYTRERPQDDNAAVLLSLDESGDVTARRDLFPRGIGYQLSYSRSGRFIAYDTLAHHGRYSTFSDLFLFDRETDQTILRSSGLRARDADIHPNGVNLAFVQVVEGRQAIVMSDSAFGEREVVYQAPSQTTRLAEPRLSPDGNAIVFIEHDDGGGEKLRLWTADGTRALTDGRSQDRDPSWTPDGRFVLFSSDRGGTFQIYAIEIATGDLKQVTHRYGGAFWPIADPRGRFLFFLDNNERGYDLVRADWKPEAWWTPDPALWLPAGGSAAARGPGLRPAEPVVPDDAPVSEARRYASRRYMAPEYLSPSFALRRAGTEWGLTFGGVDPSYRQYYDVTARWDLGYDVPVGRAYYFNAQHMLPFTVEVWRDVSAVEGGTDSLDLAQATAELYMPLGADRGRYLRVGVDGQRYARGRDVQKLAGLTAQIEADTLLAQPNDLVPERGHAYSVEASQLLRRVDTPVYIAKARFSRPVALSFLGAHSIVSATLDGAWVRNHGRDEYLLYAGGRESAPFSQGSEFELAGYDPNRLAADRLVIGRAHFTRPVAVIQRALGTSPLLVDRLAIGVRAEVGALEREGRETTAWSFGGEVLADLEISHLWPVRVTAGVYRGRPANGGETRFVVTVTGR